MKRTKKCKKSKSFKGKVRMLDDYNWNCGKGLNMAKGSSNRFQNKIFNFFKGST